MFSFLDHHVNVSEHLIQFTVYYMTHQDIFMFTEIIENNLENLENILSPQFVRLF